jgi:DNA-binding NarL/FixJ family response regulator
VPVSSRPQILLFSRDPDFAALYTPDLDAAGFAVSAAANAADLNPQFDLAAVLIDVLADSDWEAVEVLSVRVPVVVVTGWTSPDRRYRDHAFSLGAAAFVLKPVAAAILVDVVRRVIGGERRIDIYRDR